MQNMAPGKPCSRRGCSQSWGGAALPCTTPPWVQQHLSQWVPQLLPVTLATCVFGKQFPAPALTPEQSLLVAPPPLLPGHPSGPHPAGGASSAGSFPDVHSPLRRAQGGTPGPPCTSAPEPQVPSEPPPSSTPGKQARKSALHSHKTPTF